MSSHRGEAKVETLTDSEWNELIENAEGLAQELRDERVKSNQNEDGTHKVSEKDHLCHIVAKGCETTRECNCLNSGGREHDEYDYPLIGSNGKTY